MLIVPSQLFVDRMWRVFVHQNKTCVQTLEGHTHNVTCVHFHPQLPIILTGSEDGGLCILTKHLKAPTRQIHSPTSVQHIGSVRPVCHLLRYRSSVALQHLPARKHTQLWHGQGVVHLWPERLQQCGFRLRWRQHHYQGIYFHTLCHNVIHIDIFPILT